MGLRVAMLLHKPFEYDTRVRKEATALAAAGHEVHVFARAENDVPAVEVRDGVTYDSYPLRRPSRDAWQRHRARQERRLARWGDELERFGGAPGARQARLLYYGKNALEREVYLRVREAARHVELYRSVHDRLAAFAPDVVHANDVATLYAGRRWTRQHRIPLVYDAHELEVYARGRRTRYERLAARIIESAGARAASKVITVSPEIAAELERSYSVDSPVVLLNSPPLAARDQTPPFSLRDVCALAPGDILIVYSGLVVFGRGLEEATAALALLPPNYHLAVLGPRAPAPEAALLAQARRHGVEVRVHLVDPVPSLLVPATVATGDVALVSFEDVSRSYHLSLSNKLFDAVMAGIPIATSSIQATSAFVRRHELGAVFAFRDPRSLAAAVTEVSERMPAGVADRARLGRLQEEICWERQAVALCDVYARLERTRDATR